MLLDSREGDITVAVAPSNIAFAKYWGKSDEEKQWPANDSLSMTLSTAKTTTRVQCGPAGADDVLELDGQRLETAGGVGNKAFRHMHYLRQTLGFAASLRVETSNSFPRACGIASSASGMAALTMAIVAATHHAATLEELAAKGFSLQKLAYLARMGSGSAGRSLMGGYVKWERGLSAEEQCFVQVGSAEHWMLSDLIVVVSSAPKTVSSTVAHKLAWTSPLFGPRLAGHGEQLVAMEQALSKRDMKALGPLLEAEALEMHAVAMTSTPAITYINEATTAFLCWLRQTRLEKGWPAYFTLDAGCNVHVICPLEFSKDVEAAVREAFPESQLIVDRVGAGPVLGNEEKQ